MPVPSKRVGGFTSVTRQLKLDPTWQSAAAVAWIRWGGGQYKQTDSRAPKHKPNSLGHAAFQARHSPRDYPPAHNKPSGCRAKPWRSPRSFASPLAQLRQVSPVQRVSCPVTRVLPYRVLHRTRRPGKFTRAAVRAALRQCTCTFRVDSSTELKGSWLYLQIARKRRAALLLTLRMLPVRPPSANCSKTL